MKVRWDSGKDWLGAAATLFALAVTFNAEYEIAIAVHINPIVAYAVPGALDVYVLRALQVKRDVFLTVLAMVAVNAASHLVGAGVLRVSPALIVGVSAIAPLVLWRAHVLRHEVSTKPRRWWRRGTVPPVPEHVPDEQAQIQAQTDAWGNDWEHVPAFPDVCSTCFYKHEGACPDLLDVPGFEEHAAQAVDVASTCPNCGHADHDMSHRTCPECACAAELLELMSSTGPVNVPEHDDIAQIRRAWHAEYVDGCTCPMCSPGGLSPEHVPDTEERVLYHWLDVPEVDTDLRARVLSLVPPLPAGFEHVLADGDKEFLDRARALSTPTIRALKELGMGNDRARRIKQYLETEHTEAQS